MMYHEEVAGFVVFVLQDKYLSRVSVAVNRDQFSLD
jgi:hypothetical protein